MRAFVEAQITERTFPIVYNYGCSSLLKPSKYVCDWVFHGTGRWDLTGPAKIL